MAILNKIQLIGNVGKDPEVRTAGETKVANFTLATTERGYTMKNGTQVPDKTEWHNIVVWRGLAEVAEKYIRKGTQVYIEGKLTYRSYQDNNDVTKYVTEIVADNLQLLGKREDNSNTISNKETICYAMNRAIELQNANVKYNDLPF